MARYVQRLIVMGDPTMSAGRAVAVHNVQLRFPGEKIVDLNTMDLGSMSPGEVLYISAHGSPDSVGGLSPNALATKLLQAGLKTGTTIDLKSCSTAVPTDSYVRKLEARIRALSGGSIIVLIQGYTSTHVITEEGGSQAKDPTLNNPTRRQEYKAIIDRHKVEYDAATKYITDATNRNEPMEDIARTVATMTREMFKELYAHNASVAKEDSQARGTSSAVALRANLQTFIAVNLRSMDPMWGDELVLRLIREQEHAAWSNTTASYIA